ncbi:VPLPA-CTERM sorting domain-containing protein [Roseobacter sp. EG26]|uniref:VPLPA-CTERM sorting domain-containing protein n=1 Tax=Roseobacter sp. EG26 TaxID=3412477 RepID=UPI003CE4D322
MNKLVKSLAAFAVANGLLAGAASAASVIFEDDFNRANSNSVGNGWTELEDENNDVRILNNRLRLRDFLPGNPDAAAASAVIDATGYTNITVSFDWQSLEPNENNDDLFLVWALDPRPSLSNQGAWTEVFQGDSGGTNTFSESVSISPGADNSMFNLMFWSDVGNSNEGFLIDNLVVTGDLISPVPVPASLPLLAAAFAGFGVMRRRKNKS